MREMLQLLLPRPRSYQCAEARAARELCKGLYDCRMSRRAVYHTFGHAQRACPINVPEKRMSFVVDVAI